MKGVGGGDGRQYLGTGAPTMQAALVTAAAAFVLGPHSRASATSPSSPLHASSIISPLPKYDYGGSPERSMELLLSTKEPLLQIAPLVGQQHELFRSRRDCRNCKGNLDVQVSILAASSSYSGEEEYDSYCHAHMIHPRNCHYICSKSTGHMVCSFHNSEEFVTCRKSHAPS